MNVTLPAEAMTPAQRTGWALCIDLAGDFADWAIAGGQMVWLHVIAAGADPLRATEDIVVVDLRAAPSGLRVCTRIGAQDERRARRRSWGACALELTDEQWSLVEDLFDPPGRRGRPATIPRRQMGGGDPVRGAHRVPVAVSAGAVHQMEPDRSGRPPFRRVTIGDEVFWAHMAFDRELTTIIRPSAAE